MNTLSTHRLLPLFSLPLLAGPVTAAPVEGTWTLTGTLKPSAYLITQLKEPAYSDPISTRIPANPLAASSTRLNARLILNADQTFTYYEIDATATAAATDPLIGPVKTSTSGSGATATVTYSRTGNVNVTDPYATASNWTPVSGISQGTTASKSPTTASAGSPSWTQSLVRAVAPNTTANGTSVTNPAWSFFYWTPYTGTWTVKRNRITLSLDTASTSRLYAVYNGNTSAVPGASNSASPAFNQQRYRFTGTVSATRAGTTALILNQATYLNIDKAFSSATDAIPKGTWSMKYRYVKKLKSQ